MSDKSGSTLIADLYHVPGNGKAEIVRGELVHMSPTGFLPGRASSEIYISLRQHARREKTGHAVPDNVGFIVNLPHRQSFSPDAAFFTGSIPPSLKFLTGAPVFAVEVRSEGDYGPAAEAEMAEKRADYFAAGTQVVWDVDLRGDETVRSYRADAPKAPTIYRRGQTAAAEPAVPGWRMPVDDLFID